MKNHLFILSILLFPLIIFSQNVEVEGGIIADSIDVSSGLIKNVADPISAQDAATKAYVDLLEAKLDSLINILFPLSVQQRLDLGETPIEIYNSDNSLLDSLYGKNFQGGLIAYLNTNTGTGLIAAPINQSQVASWGCQGTTIPGTSFDIGTGQANTTLIVNGCSTSGIAARICDDLNDWGYDDWFLPSLEELDELRKNLYLKGLGGFQAVLYWSSTEVVSLNSWAESFSNGDYNSTNKSVTLSVRAVRAF